MALPISECDEIIVTNESKDNYNMRIKNTNENIFNQQGQLNASNIQDALMQIAEFASI